jgi:hypothetical protein
LSTVRASSEQLSLIVDLVAAGEVRVEIAEIFPLDRLDAVVVEVLVGDE